MSLESSQLHVGLDDWIIQDGDYGDFEVGQKARFALEFYPPQELQFSPSGPSFADHLVADRYRIRGQVVFSGSEAWVIDTGRFLAFEAAKPPSHSVVGKWVEGTVELGILPCFYFERLHTTEGMPPLSYEWLVREIHLDSTPWKESKDEDGRTLQIRDRSCESFVPVTRTDAWHDDLGFARWVLRCEQLAGPR